jgi:hypothetical protein
MADENLCWKDSNANPGIASGNFPLPNRFNAEMSIFRCSSFSVRTNSWRNAATASSLRSSASLSLAKTSSAARAQAGADRLLTKWQGKPDARKQAVRQNVQCPASPSIKWFANDGIAPVAIVWRACEGEKEGCSVFIIE